MPVEPWNEPPLPSIANHEVLWKNSEGTPSQEHIRSDHVTRASYFQKLAHNYTTIDSPCTTIDSPCHLSPARYDSIECICAGSPHPKEAWDSPTTKKGHRLPYVRSSESIHTVGHISLLAKTDRSSTADTVITGLLQLLMVLA